MPAAGIEIQAMKVVLLAKTTTEKLKLKDAKAVSRESVMQIDQAAMAAAEAMIVDEANMFNNPLPH